MMLTVKEMEALCIFHDGTRTATLEQLRGAIKKGGVAEERIADIQSLIEKLSKMSEGDVVCLGFEREK